MQDVTNSGNTLLTVLEEFDMETRMAVKSMVQTSSGITLQVLY